MRALLLLLALVSPAFAQRDLSLPPIGNPNSVSPRMLNTDTGPIDGYCFVATADGRKGKWKPCSTVNQAFCGDGVINGTDECDGTTLPAGDATCVSCDPTCHCIRAAVCGNGMVETGEQCDPPGSLGTGGNGCSGGQVCDPGCGGCTTTVCGNSMVEGGEVCDPPFETGGCAGALICNAACTICGTCGDGNIDAGEQCDPGDTYSQTTDGSPAANDSNCDGQCQPDCTCPDGFCGDGVVQFLRGEVCDPTPHPPNPNESCPFASCTGTCFCNCGPQAGGGPVGGTCGDGILQKDCIGLNGSANGNDETCETATTGLGNAIDYAAAGYHDTNLDATLDPGTNDVIVEALVRIDDATVSPMRVVNKGGVVITGGAQGWSADIACVAGLCNMVVNTSDASTNPGCNLQASSLQPNVLYHLVWIKTGTTCRAWRLNVTAHETTHTRINRDSGTTVTTPGNSSPDVFIGARNTGATPFNGVIDEVTVRVGMAYTTYEASYMDQEWSTPACQHTGITTGWQFDESGSGALVSCGGTSATSVNSGWSRITSPFAGQSSTGCPTGQTCNSTTCQCETTCTSNCGGTGTNIYISPTGSDSNNGTSSSTPVLHWSTAFGLVAGAGYSVIAEDGTYTSAANGDLNYDCGVSTRCDAGSGTRPCGTSNLPITIKAQNERQAWIQGTGVGYPVHIDNCRFVTLQGFRVTNADHTLSAGSQSTNVWVTNSDDVTIRRNLISTNNRYGNDHLLAYENGFRPVIEENEFYDYHRHAMSIWKDIGGYIRGNYCNSRDRADLAGGVTISGSCGPVPCNSNWTTGGDECVSLYGSNGVTVENNISEANSGGFQAHPGTTFNAQSPYAGTDYGGSDNLIVGNISRADRVGFYCDARSSTPPIAVRNNVFADDIDIAHAGTTHSFNCRAATNVTYQNDTATGNTVFSGFNLDESETGICTTLNSQGDPCSATLRNNGSYNNAGSGFLQTNITTDYNPCNYTNLATTGNSSADSWGGGCTAGTATDGTITVTGYGTGASQSVVWVPHGGNDLDGNGETSSTAYRVCQGTTGDAWEPCTANADCATSGSCLNDIGANILCRVYKGERTANTKCVSAGTGPSGAAWPCCTGAGTGDCDVWARDSDVVCGSTTCANNANCLASDTWASGTASMPACRYHFFGAGAFVTTSCTSGGANNTVGSYDRCNDVDGDSAFDVHERAGLNLGSTGTKVTPPACP